MNSNVYCLNWYCGKKEKNDFSEYPEILTTPIARNPNKKTYLSIRQLGAENYLARKLPLEAMTKSPHICISDRRRSANQEPWWTGSGGEFAAVILARTLTVRICPFAELAFSAGKSLAPKVAQHRKIVSFGGIDGELSKIQNVMYVESGRIEVAGNLQKP